MSEVFIIWEDSSLRWVAPLFASIYGRHQRVPVHYFCSLCGRIDAELLSSGY